MIVAVGVDSVAIARIERLLAQAGERFLARVYAAAERDYCRLRARPAASLAARFAAKEAVLKCLGTGFGRGLALAQVEVVRRPGGAVGVVLHGAAAAVASRLGIRAVHLSLSHTERDALAFAVATD